MATAVKKTATKPAAEAVEAVLAIQLPVVKLPKLPTKLGDMADQLYSMQKTRLAIEKLAAQFEEREKELKELIINNLPKSSQTGAIGKLCSVRVENKDVVRVADWDAFHKFLITQVKKDDGAWAMMQKRVNDATILEMLDKGAKVAGVEKLQVPVVRMNKV